MVSYESIMVRILRRLSPSRFETITKVMVSNLDGDTPTILSRRYAPAKSVQSSYLTLSGCYLLSQGGPGVRLRAEAAAYAILARLSTRIT